ncbi:MAG: hypothetical protein QNJ46_24700 [Leptolyngbyaceae cyanobacterium MO_188.B28]|nr:hypothetical protein [Leptolyngbyaceae cyanobacterium MO_188.B28]
MHLPKKQSRLKPRLTYIRKQSPKGSAWSRRSPTSILRFSSILFAIAGGILLALNIEASRYGFLVLAGSSGQLLIASLWRRDRTMIAYSLSLFLCVDCLGVWRWILHP